MKHRVTLSIILIICALLMVVSAQNVKQTMTNSPNSHQSVGDITTSPKAPDIAAIKGREVKVPPNYINMYMVAQQRTIDAFKVATNTPEWKNYVIMLNQQETVLTGIQGELGIKPLTDNCKPIFLRDGKRTLEDGSTVDASNGKLDHFECPPAKEQKP